MLLYSDSTFQLNGGIQFLGPPPKFASEIRSEAEATKFCKRKTKNIKDHKEEENQIEFATVLETHPSEVYMLIRTICMRF